MVLLGPRQVGKTTLAQAVAAKHPEALFLDLEKASDRTVTAAPELFFPAHRDRLIVIDEVQHAPQLFAALRPEIDAARRPGRFLLLGSASGELLRQSSESLAGRVSYLELAPFMVTELRDLAVRGGPSDMSASALTTLQTLWLRGGYPLAFLANDEASSFQWRQDFLRTFLERDLVAMGVRIPAETLRRFWTMLAHLQGQLLNASQLGLALGGASHNTALRYLDALVDTMMVRRLQPLTANVGKRLVKSPKVYVRDSGLLHALLGLGSVRDLQGHAVAGWSWEGFVIEQIAGLLQSGSSHAAIGFYRTTAGAELDLVVERGSLKIGIEIKFASAPKLSKGFWHALDDLQISQAYVVAPVPRRYMLEQTASRKVEVIPLWDLDQVLRG